MTRSIDRLLAKANHALVLTEVTAQTLACARGATGQATIRSGTRTVPLGPLGALTFYVDPVVAASIAGSLASRVRETRTLDDANDALHAAGVRTELDFKRTPSGHGRADGSDN